MNMLKAFFVVSLFALLFSCASEADAGLFSALEQKAKANPSRENIDTLYKAYSDHIKEIKADTANVKSVLDRAISMFEELNYPGVAIAYQMSAIRYENEPESFKNKVLELAGDMSNLNKNNASMALYYSFLKAFPDHPGNEEIRSKLPGEIEDIDAFLADLGQKIFEDPDNSGINRNAALRFVDACEAYALVLPNDPEAPQFLYKASEISQTLRTIPKTMGIFDWMIDQYPDFEKTSNAMFLKAYLLDEEYERKEDAALLYQQFLESYPDHQLASSAKFLLENIGKTDAEIYEMITNKNEEQ